MTQSAESVGHGAAKPSAAHGEGEVFDPADHRPSARALRILAGAAVVAVGALLAVGIVPRILHRAELTHDEQIAASAEPRVQVATAHREAAGAPVVLPGSVQPFAETSVYARANGYIRKWTVDIGAEVKKGQVLVELDLPDVDEELRQSQAAAQQAEAAIAQAKSQLELAQANNHRYAALAPSGVVSTQETEQYSSQFAVAQANVAAAQAAYGSAVANERRASDLRSFGTVVAPFDGVVTLRAAEVGQLVVSGTGQGQPLFKVAEVDVVRVFVNVPQLYASGVHAGMDAQTTIREARGRVFAGKVARTSNELDTATRSLLVEVDIPNPDRALVSGMYATVTLDVRRQDAPLFIPATAALIDARGTRVALVEGGVIHWRPVDIEADQGDRLALAGGVNEGDAVAVTPSDRLLEGMHVHPESSR